jgi:hypothetical protein
LNYDGTITVGINNDKLACFSATDIGTGNKKVGDITNVDFTAGALKIDVILDNLQIYSI